MSSSLHHFAPLLRGFYVAVDITVMHPLAPSLGLSVRQAKEAAADKERQNIAKYAHLKREKLMNFIPVCRRQLVERLVALREQGWKTKPVPGQNKK